LQELLSEKGIPSMIYYPVPSHKQEMLKDFGGALFELPVTDFLNRCVISLPIHTELTQEELSYISGQVNQIVNQLSAS
jgi:dTDP-4-amino-4,6-dideoxygalactose transaminase